MALPSLHMPTRAFQSSKCKIRHPCGLCPPSRAVYLFVCLLALLGTLPLGNLSHNLNLVEECLLFPRVSLGQDLLYLNTSASNRSTMRPSCAIAEILVSE
jgi:hypothetical protein